ncbi:MAG: NosD domain-containing protein [Candidatus Bathyarchaeia archaeon]
MKVKTALTMVLIAFLTVILTLPTNVRQAKATDGFGYIYIKADGSIDPPDAPISKDAENMTYSLTADITNKTIIIERNNIIFDGNNYKISGPEEYGRFGINITSRNNVTIKNTVVEKFYIGIHVRSSTKITITENNASYNKIFYIMEPDFEIIWEGYGIAVYNSNETIIYNNTLSNNLCGIDLGQSNGTRIDCNKIYDNEQYEPSSSTWYGWGIYIRGSKNITTINNTVLNNGVYGVYGASSSGAYSSENVAIGDNTIKEHTYGVLVAGYYDGVPRNYVIANNSIVSNLYGIYCSNSQNQTIMNNNVSANSYGIYLYGSMHNTVVNNTLFKNAEGITLENYTNNSKILSNAVLNSSSFGIYIRSSSNNNLVVGNNVSNNSRGIRFTQSNNNTIFGNTISSNTNDGLIIYYYSSNNKVSNNNITLNNIGLTLTYDCYNNKIFHNNFIDNTQHVLTDVNSTWDNGYPSGGNYWSNYTGVDSNCGSFQNETGSDGIGDTAHVINMNNTDGYPLMAPINTFNAGIWDAESRYVEVISNSTVSNFKINIAEKVISFNVTGETGSGICRVIIPNTIVNTLWLGNYKVLVNGLAVEFRNWTDAESTYIYFTYSHSEHEVTIIPEFPHIPALLILMLTLTATTALTKKTKQTKTLFF